MMTLIWILGLFAVVNAGPAAKDANISGYKDQYCTDPRTMRKHAAYTEWADAYSCTRHRCQPGGRNLAIYTVGCKRVEAPESAIECEEVVEDTNMQFPFCCTRLRCLVVVRGEVWTRVLGQPWEVLPAAPWSHMYKMKKPPPSDTAFQPKTSEQGPVYELSEPETDSHDKNLRSGRKVATTDSPDCNEIVPRSAPAAAPSPDIVIALSTNSDKDHIKKSDIARLQGSVQPSGMNWQTQSHGSESESEQKRSRKNQEPSHFFEKDDDRDHHDPDMQDLEDPSGVTDKPPEGSDEKFFENAAFSQKEKQSHKGLHHQAAWTDIPQNQWNEQHEGMDVESRANVMELRYTQEPSYHHPEYQAPDPEKVERKEKSEKPNNLQALVDAIGTRMRDIENVVQRMSEKVHQTKSPPEFSGERRSSGDLDYGKHHKSEVKDVMKMKHEREREREPSGSEDEQKAKPRFAVRNRGSKYLSPSTDPTSEQPLFIEDNPNYFNDASNAVRRSNLPKLSSVSGADNNDGRAIKEPAQSAPTYMAPVENHRKSPAHIPVAIDTSDDLDRKKKKHTHKKRRNKAHSHKKRHNQDKRKHFNKLTSVEIDKNVVMSMEDSSALVN